jgi:hypothetical protein
MLPGVLLLVPACVAGCQGGESGPVPVPVKGTVVYRDKPLKTGSVYFVVPGEPPTVLPVTDGAFEGQVLPGTRRVEFRAYRTVARKFDPTEDAMEFVVNDLPGRYGTGSKVTAEIKEGGPNEFAFKLDP